MDVDKFRILGPDEEGWIYLDNPSPMALVATKRWFSEIIGKENCHTYCLGGFLGNFTNSFKFKEEFLPLIKERVFPELVLDGKYYRRKESMTEANSI